MKTLRLFKLNTDSNLINYKVRIYDNCPSLSCNLSNCDKICFLSNQDYVWLVATPVENGYYNKIYYKLDLRYINEFYLYFKFFQNPMPKNRIYNFTLTDRNYNIPIDATLNFNMIS